MKQYSLFILVSAALVAAFACDRTEQDATPAATDGTMAAKYWAKTPDGAIWNREDKIGVYTSDDANVPFGVNYLEEGKENRALFEGKISQDATVFAAYYPYDKEAGENLSSVFTAIPETVTAGDEPVRFDIATFNDAADIKFSFRRKLAILSLSFSNLEGSTIEGLEVSSISIKGRRNIVGLFRASLANAEQNLSGVDGGVSSELVINFSGEALKADTEVRAAIAATWRGGDEISVSINEGAYVTSVIVASPAEEGQVTSLVVNAEDFNPRIDLVWKSPLLGREDGAAEAKISGTFPAVDNSGNVYAMLSLGTDKLYKLKAEDGSIAWSTPLGYSFSSSADIKSSPSCEPDGSVIYAAGGTGGSGRIVAVNGADGSIKWEYTSDKFFGNGNTPAPNFNYSAPAIGADNIYVGNAGTTGTVQAINKATGERVSYIANLEDGTGGPAGGVMSGMGISKSGEVAWVCNYGIFTAHSKDMDAPARTHETFGAYANWAQRFSHGWTYNTSRSSVAISADGVWAAVMEKTTSGVFNMHVLRSSLNTSATLSYEKGVFDLDYKINDITSQDQGGIVIGNRGEAIVSLKGTPGYIMGITPAGDLAYKYIMPAGQDVVGSCALDNNGYIHVVTDKPAYYAILEPDYTNKTCNLVALADLSELLGGQQVRAWTSVVIGNDGKVYLGVTLHDNWNNYRAQILCLTYPGVTGPSTVSPWPQRSADAAHTGIQK